MVDNNAICYFKKHLHNYFQQLHNISIIFCKKIAIKGSVVPSSGGEFWIFESLFSNTSVDGGGLILQNIFSKNRKKRMKTTQNHECDGILYFSGSVNTNLFFSCRVFNLPNGTHVKLYSVWAYRITNPILHQYSNWILLQKWLLRKIKIFIFVNGMRQKCIIIGEWYLKIHL